MENKILTIFITLLISTTLSAQNEIDALRYSTHNLSGSARYASMGGAFGSLGGEFSSLSSNPAGLGMYQFSEFSFTPNFNLNNTRSYSNIPIDEYRSTINISSLGLVLSIPKEKQDWKRLNIGLGWNQLADYNSTIRIEASSSSSIVDKIIDLTAGTLIGELSSGNSNPYSEMAWDTYLIDPEYADNILIDGSYISNFSNAKKSQTKLIKSSGSINEFVFSVATSYKDKLYLGVTLGIPTINYHQSSEYIESESTDTANNLRSMNFSEEISAYGSGYNIKFGGIYRITNKTKIGVSIHTPTFFSIKEDYNTSITTYFKDSTLASSMGYRTPFNYHLITPLKSSISASRVFNKNILLSAEYEVLDYSKSKYLSSGFENDNKTITESFQKTSNLKLGAEMTINNLAIRSGYAKYGSAYTNKEFSSENYSFGLGINSGSYYFDLAYILSQSKNEHRLYDENFIGPTQIAITNHKLLVTLGFRY